MKMVAPGVSGYWSQSISLLLTANRICCETLHESHDTLSDFEGGLALFASQSGICIAGLANASQSG
jgi:hypothetical protein